METQVYIIAVCSVLLITYILKFVNRRNEKLQIPTVPGWPIVGNLFQLDRKRPYLTMIEWARKLGPVYVLKVFHETWIVVSGYDELVEMLVTKGNSFAGRARRFQFDALTYADKDILNGNPTQRHWTPLRKAAYRGIRHYGDGMMRLESTLSMMAQEFVAKIRSYDGEEVDLHDDIYNFVLKVAVTMISGQKVSDENSEQLSKMKVFENLFSSMLVPPRGVELEIFPWLLHLGHPLNREIQYICRLRDELWDEMWQESQKSYTSDGDASCIMHSIAQLLDKDSQYYDSFLTMEHAKGLFADLVLASIATTSNFAYALPNILLHNQHVLQRLQQESDVVLGPNRQPSIFDRDQMPYSVATVYELLRYASLVPTVPHVGLETETIGGYTIQPGTFVIPLYTAVLHDKKLWGDPEVFRPERFLNDDGNLLPADHPTRKHMLQFGAGPRVCIGEAFALKRLFIILVSIVQSFDLQGGAASVSCEFTSYRNGALLHHQPYTIKLIARQR